MEPDASELLFALQVFVPSLLLVLLLTSFLPRSAQSGNPSEGRDEIAGIIPVILPITLPRVGLLVALLLLLSVTHVVSLTWMLVLFNGFPPTIALFTSVGGTLAWLGAAYSIWKSGGKRVGWAKAMGWVGLVGEAWMGSERVWLFVKWTGSFPPGSFPLPAFLHLILLSIRLLLLVLVLWALYDPVRDFIPAPPPYNPVRNFVSTPRRRGDNGRSSDERQTLLGGQEGEGSGSPAKDGVAGAGEGYGTFGVSGEEERIEGRGSSSKTSISQKTASPTSSPLTEPASAESLIPITAASPSPDEVEVEDPVESLTPPPLSPVDENGSERASGSSTPPPPPPIQPPTADEPSTQPSFAAVVASTAAESTSAAPLPKSNSLTFPSGEAFTESSRSITPSPDAEGTSLAPILASPVVPSSHTMSPSASSTITTGTAGDSPSVSTKEKRKRLASLSDIGRKMSDEGKGLVRRVSLMGRKSSSSNVNNFNTSSPGSPSSEVLGGGGRASPSPMNSPGGRSSLNGVLPEAREGDGASSFVSNGSGATGGLKKRLSLLTRKSSTASGSNLPAPAEAPVAGAEATDAARDTKKKPFVTKNGRNGKGKKTKKK